MEATFTESSHREIDTGIKTILWVSVFISILPFLLQLGGADFASHPTVFPYDKVHEMAKDEIIDAHFYKLSGALVHTILEWSAVIVAVFTVILSFTHYAIKRSSVTPIIGVALFMAGCMDAFHTLAADRLIEATASNTDLIPFTWAICRAFNVAIMITGVCIIMAKTKSEERKTGLGFVMLTSLVFGVIAWAIIHYCATEAQLPKTMFPENIITRPWDLISLFLFLIAGTLIFPIFHKRNPSLFSAAIWISVIPQLATQAHMAFGSTELFDHHFNVAHFLKIIAYLVPCTGLLLDYINTQRQELLSKAIALDEKAKVEILNEKLIRANASATYATKEAETLARDLQRSNQDLEEFAYVASHDLKAPLRGIDNLAGWIEEDLKEVMQGEAKENMGLLRGRIKRLESLLDDLLAYSRAGKMKGDHEIVNSKLLAIDVASLFNSPNLDLKIKVDDTLPTFTTQKTPLEQVFRNLINNAIKHHDRKSISIEITAKQNGEFISFSVKDDGPGIAPEYHERIFEMFKTLKPRDEIEGSGMGLTIIKKLLDAQGGKIRVESQIGKRGTNFIFDWKKQ